MAEFNGYLCARLAAIGTKSEGPAYFLQLWDYDEIPVVKKVWPWENEPELHKRLGTKVTIIGDFEARRIIYKEVKDFGVSSAVPEEKLELALELETTRDNLIWIRPAAKQKPKHLEFEELAMTLRVKWPYRSIWEGACPTSQTYDFVIYAGEGGGQKEIWRWSKDRVFLQMVTPVKILGGDFHGFAREVVRYPAELLEEGVYTVEGVFVATGQTAERVIEVRAAVSA